MPFVGQMFSGGDRWMIMDETDVKILKSLVSDARLSSRQISKKSGVSIGTVLTRMKKMEKEGVVRGYSAVVDHEKLGYMLTALIEITVSKGRLLEMENEIARMPNVCAVYDVTGLTDAFVVAKFKSREDLSVFAKRLLSMPYVERSNTHVVLTTIKEDFRLV
ncbi:MAG: Lrp/AsnC family transcriptional regulator [Candidatus Bathyarchaeota archaeon]|nr:Lrp/AsnC family transcriptional regulator [Candidatus Bathyarchaeota archaeon]